MDRYGAKKADRPRPKTSQLSRNKSVAHGKTETVRKSVQVRESHDLARTTAKKAPASNGKKNL